MAVCLGCGLEIDSTTGKLGVNLKGTTSGINCDSDGQGEDGLFINPGCGLKIAADNSLLTNTNQSTIAQGEGSGAGFGTAFGTGPGIGSPATDGNCLTGGKNGLICDTATGVMWAPGKVGVYGTGMQSVASGANLSSILSPLNSPADFLTGYQSDSVLGNGGAEALCWEVENNTCEYARGIINSNVRLPTFFVKRGEVFRFALWERLNYKAALDGLPLVGQKWALQSQAVVDLRWMLAAGPGVAFPAGSGMAYTAVLFDFSNLDLPPGTVARGESTVTINRIASGPDSNALSANNDFFVDHGTNAEYQHEYRVTVAGGHVILPSSPNVGGGNGGSINNGVATAGLCFFGV